MRHIRFRTATRSPDGGRGALIALLPFICGVLGVLFLFTELPDVTFDTVPVCLLLTLICAALFACNAYRRRLLPLVLTLYVAGQGIFAWHAREEATAELRRAFMHLVDPQRPMKLPIDITTGALFTGLIMISVIFLLEFVLQFHALLYLFTLTLIVLLVSIGIRPSAGTLFLLLLFQVLFLLFPPVFQSPRHLRLTSKRTQTMGGVIVSVLLFVTALFAGPLIDRDGSILYNAVSMAEGAVVRTIRANSPYADTPLATGEVSRLNNYPSGAVHLRINTTKLPDGPLYLTGFSGGDYLGGNFAEVDEDAVIRDMLEHQDETLPDYLGEDYRAVMSRIFGAYGYSYVPKNEYPEAYILLLKSTLENLPMQLSVLSRIDPEDGSFEMDFDVRELAISHENGDHTHLFKPYGGYLTYLSPAIAYDREAPPYISSYYLEMPLPKEEGYVYEYRERDDLDDDRAIDWDALVELYSNPYDPVGPPAYYVRIWQWLLHAYGESAERYFTRVSPRITPRIAQLAEEADIDREDLSEVTSFILYTLTSNCSYSLTPGITPFMNDPLEYFLFERQSGYCIHYAGAATLMYRFFGIPARYAAGYLLTADDFTETEDGYYTAEVTDDKAHAWTELWIEDVGFVPVEVTPSADGALSTSFPGFDEVSFQTVLEKNNWNPLIPSLGRRMSKEPATESARILPEFTALRVKTALKKDLVPLGCFLLFWGIMLLPLLFLRYLERRNAPYDASGIPGQYSLLIRTLHRKGYVRDHDGTERTFISALSKELPDGLTKEDLKELATLRDTALSLAYGRPGAVTVSPLARESASDLLRKLKKLPKHHGPAQRAPALHASTLPSDG